MKLKFFIAGMAIVAGLASAVSCQDLSKDLTALQNKVNSLEATVQGLQAKIDGGAVITSVTPTNSGIVIVLSNGNKYEITNGTNGKDGKDGKDGAAGSVVTIGANGNWFIDGVDTGLAAQGKDGVDGKDGHGEYYVPNAETGKFDKYSWDAEKGEYVKTPTTISFLTPGVVTAVFDTTTGALTLYGVVDEKGKEIEGGVVITTGSSKAPAGEMTPVNAGDYKTDGWIAAGNIKPNLVAVTKVDNDFYGMVFKAGEQTVEPVVAYISISPKDAVLDPKDVCFVNSKGEVLPYIKAFDVEKQDDKPQTKAEAVTYSIWKVSYGLDMDVYDATEFAKAIYVDPALKPTPNKTGNWIAFALKAGEAATDYDFAFSAPVVATTSSYLQLFIGGKTASDEVINYKNRFTTYTDKAWKPSTAAIPTPAAAASKTGTAATENWQSAATITSVNLANDNRTTVVKKYPANVDTEFSINVGKLVGTDFVADANVAALYVEIDYKSTTDISEENAWKSYEAKIEGLNVVQKGNVAKINIKDEAANGDEILFRVHAVNQNGTLVDPDGKSFSVQVGKEGTEWSDVATELSTPAQYLAAGATKSTAKVTIDAKKVTGAATYDFVMDTKNNPKVKSTGDVMVQSGFQLVFSDEKSTPTKVTVTPGTGVSAAAFAANDFKSVIAQNVNPNLYEYADGKPYTGTLTIYDVDGRVLVTMKATFTKTPPQAAPANSWSKRAGQLIDNIWHAYPTAAAPAVAVTYATWKTNDAAKDTKSNTKANAANLNGVFNLNKVFNFTSNVGDFSAVLDGAGTYNATTKKNDDLKINKGSITTNTNIRVFNIDGTTAYKSHLYFDYGNVSSAQIEYNTAGSFVAVHPYTYEVCTFNTYFHSIFETGNMSWDWEWYAAAGTVGGSVVYGSEYYDPYAIVPGTALVDAYPLAIVPPTNVVSNQIPEIRVGKFGTGLISLGNIFGTSAWDTDNESLPLSLFDGAELQIMEMTLTSNETGLEDYYRVAPDGLGNILFTMVEDTPLTVAVPSKLTILCNDPWGNLVTIVRDVKIMP